MSTGYRKLIAWATLATAVILALSVGIAKAEEPLEPVECVTDAATGEVVCSYPLTEQTTTTEPTPGVPFGGDCDAPLLPASYELGAPCVPFDICTGSTTLWQLSPCTEGDRIAQCSSIVEQFQVIPQPCGDLTPLFDVCGPDGTRRWSVTPCEYQPADIAEPQAIDPVLPKTGSTTNTLLAIAAALVLLGLAVRSCARQMDDEVTL